MTFDQNVARNLLHHLGDLTMAKETIIMYLYCYAHNGESPTLTEMREDTTMNIKTIRRHLELLEAHGVLTRGEPVGRGGRREIKLTRISSHTKPSSLPLITSILDIPSQKSNATRILASTRKSGGSGTAQNTGRFGVRDIVEDEDWKKAEAVLSKYFKPFEIDPSQLTSKNRFMKLCDLLEDDTLDFERYAKWYFEEKYPSKRFNFGLFLFPNMVAEFRDAMERDDTYLHTSSRMEKSESHKKGIVDTTEFIVNLTKGEDGAE